VYSLTLRKVLTLVAVGALVLPASSSSASMDFRLDIPRIHLNAPINYRSQDLGPFAYFQDSNTLAIAGHRVTHTHPFYYINLVKDGDPIYVWYNGHRNKYVVKRTVVMKPEGLRKIRWWPGLILSGCTPRHYATYRIVVLAKLTK
jgi:LPXTG-site transpeptidase (sortase) family protein